MRNYEIMFIVRPTLGEDEIKTVASNFQKTLETNGAKVTNVDAWGQKTLAYEVVKDLHGVEEAELAKKKSEEIFSNRGMSDETESIEVSYDEELNLGQRILTSRFHSLNTFCTIHT